MYRLVLQQTIYEYKTSKYLKKIKYISIPTYDYGSIRNMNIIHNLPNYAINIIYKFMKTNNKTRILIDGFPAIDFNTVRLPIYYLDNYVYICNYKYWERQMLGKQTKFARWEN